MLVDRAKMTEHTFMIIAAVIIGLLGGYAAVGFRSMINFISETSFGGSGTVLERITASPWYMKLLVPFIGGLVVGPIITFFAREAKGHGVPEVQEAILLKGGAIRTRVAFIKALVSSVSIGTGGSVGREGPIVGVGSTIGSTLGQFLRVSPERMKTFVGCGAAAGIAAAFNAPIAGSLFAVEILLGDFTFRQFSPIVVSSVLATVVSHRYEGNIIAFRVPDYKLTSPDELALYFVLGILCGLAAYIFIRLLYFSEDLFDEKIKMPEYLRPGLGGIIIGIIALRFPEVMGVGYESITEALQEDFIWQTAIILALAKIVATSVTIGSGGSGGIFAPSLFIGAMLGYAFGWLAHTNFPGFTSTAGAYALVAMGGLVAGTTHAPITAILIVFEMTSDYSIILPLMITSIVSTIVSSKLSRESIYSLKLVRRGIQMKEGAEINVMKSLFVKNIYTKDFDTIQENSRFDQVVNRVISGNDLYFPVINKKGALRGIISMHDIKDSLFDRDILQDLLIAGDIANRDVETVSIHDNCQAVIDKLGRLNIEGIPVVDPRRPKQVLGMIWRSDVLDAYNREIKKRDITSSYASQITMKNIDREVHFIEGYSMTEVPVPGPFVGKSIRELNIRAKYGVDILLIRTNTGEGSKIKSMPSADYIFSYDDSIVISGEIGKINLLKQI